MRDRWNLPGPTKFVRSVVDKLAAGCHVQVRLPAFGAAGLFAALRDRLERDGGLSIDSFDCAAVPGSPFGLLEDHFADAAGEPSASSAAGFLRRSRRKGGAIWLDGLEATRWPAWKRALSELDAATRNQEKFERTLLVLPLYGALAEEAAPEDVCVAAVTYDGMVSELDSTIYARLQFVDLNVSALREELAAQYCVALGAWDFDLVDEMAESMVDTPSTALAVLQKYLEARGWSGADSRPTWTEGTAHLWRGQVHAHSAFVLASGEVAELDRRMWRAQLRVLFPYIEECRLTLLERFRSRLSVPFETRQSVVERIEDLEIGHIESQLARCTMDRATRDLIRALRSARNALSHLECVPSADLSTILAHEANQRPRK